MDQVGNNASQKGTTQFKRKGQTSGAFGNDPAVQAKGSAKQTPGSGNELKP